MIYVKTEPDDYTMWGIERCCFCREKTKTWYEPKDVACCQRCANYANEEDVPTKQEWLRRERIANGYISRGLV